jgi:CheY-like chemotaxis protein
VLYAPDGQKAWELFQENKNRMAITDWIMPEMDGPTFCGKIRDLNLPEYIYIILLTAKGDKDCSDGTERVQKIVHEMRYFAHQGQQAYENEVVGTLIEPVLQEFQSEIKDKIQLTTALPEGLAVPCNPPHMEEGLPAIDAQRRGSNARGWHAQH